MRSLILTLLLLTRLLKERNIRDKIQPSCSWSDEAYYQLSLVAEESSPVCPVSSIERSPDVGLVQELPQLLPPIHPGPTIYVDFPSVSDTWDEWSPAEMLEDLISSDPFYVFLCITLDLLGLLYYWKRKPKEEDDAGKEAQSQEASESILGQCPQPGIAAQKADKKPKKKHLGFRVRKRLYRAPRKVKKSGKAKEGKNEFASLSMLSACA
ncbi:uncharacterized protein LOC108704187 [Xenopus laevis]|uniref:Uncharacterized protein LOC108704187 n=1 Tax=Xenopus laevis TaxID=8355 RepID=A0A8J0U4T2_XENLA|nr:uncharacterized protein LOC108704187 [Xenopus laevis]OCT58302.1 hypothetical protein XELAEV_18002240mg [Xenopus laevis]